MKPINLMDPTTWPALQACERVSAQIVNGWVRDPGALAAAGSVLSAMLQARKAWLGSLGVAFPGAGPEAP